MKKIFYISLCLVVLFIFSCANETEKTDTTDNEIVEAEKTDASDHKIVETESFDTFYDKFLTDKAFQMERVKFPIEGSLVLDYEKSYEWTKDNWELITKHIDEVNRTEFTVEIENLPEMVSHKIYIPNSGLSLSYSFELIDGKWFLTKCSEINL